MEREKFLELQFQTLRKEIEDTKGRIFTLEIGGVSIPILPIVIQIFYDVINQKGNSNEEKLLELKDILGDIVALLTMAAPFFIIVLIIVFVAEKKSLMRCGRYIRCHIEPFIPYVTGWETWLENDSERRSSDKSGAWSFTSLWVAYYVFTSLLAGFYLFGRYPIKIWQWVLGFFVYSIIGFFMWRWYHRQIPSFTTTADELEPQLFLNADNFMLRFPFILSATSNDNNPFTKEVSLQVDAVSTTIPAGRFQPDKQGRFKFKKGTWPCSTLKVIICRLKGRRFVLRAERKRVRDLPVAKNPVKVKLTIGDDSGTTTMTPKRGKW